MTPRVPAGFPESSSADAAASAVPGAPVPGAPVVPVPHPGAVLAALLVVQACFGTNYVVSKVVVSNFPPLVWAGIRISVATAVMFSTCLALKRKRPPMNREFLLPLVGFALLGTILNQASFLVGLSLTTSANSAVLNTLIPVATLAIVTLRKQEAFNSKKGAGFVLALAGVITIRRFEDVRFSDVTFIGDCLNVLNCLLYACFLSYSKKFMSKYDALWTTAFLFLYGTIGLNLLAIPKWIAFSPPTMTPQLWAVAAFAVVFGTLVPYFLNFWALKYASPSQVALFIYLQPIFAAAMAWLWLDQSPTLRVGLSSALIFSGMLVAMSGSYAKAAPRETSK